MSLKAYVINLDRRKDRLEAFENNFSSLGFDLERVQAIDKHQLDPGQGTTLNLGEIACWLSHLKVINLFLTTDNEHCLVFEDDAMVMPHRMAAVEAVTQYVIRWMEREKVTVVQLGHITRFYRKHHRQGFGYYITQLIQGSRAYNISDGFRLHKGQFRSGAHAYIISREAAKQLKNANNPPLMASDNYFGVLAQLSIGRKNQSLQFASLAPPLFEQISWLPGYELDSDISKN